MAARHVPKKKKTRHQPESAAAALDDIQSLGDQLAAWVGENPVIVLGSAAVVLLAAAIYGLAVSSMQSSRDAASIALAQAQIEYREAMGAPPGAIEIPEPANPEIARQTRSKYIGRFQAIADEYEGETTGSMALLQVGNFQSELGDDAAALESWQTAADWLAKDDPMRGIVLERMASAYEVQGDFAKAAAVHQEASEIPTFPLRYTALVNAARCLDAAGDAEGALAAFSRVQNESPDLVIPEYVEARMRELEIAKSR